MATYYELYQRLSLSCGHFVLFLLVVSLLLYFYASANEVAGGIMFSGCRPSVCPYVRTYLRPYVRLSSFVCVDISRIVRRFYIKLGMRVYPGGTILWVDF